MSYHLVPSSKMSMMGFSQANFNSSEWINQALRERDDENLEAYLASLNLKIHVASQEKSDQLEYCMLEIASSTPRIHHDLQRIEEHLKHLSTEMTSVHSQLLSLEQKNSSGIEQLYSLDTLKSNLEKSRDILQQHHTWNHLLNESKVFIEGSTKLSESADRLELMAMSLQTLAKMPGHEERQSTYHALQKNLLDSFLPKIRKDLLAADLSPLHEYVYVYQKINKIEEFEVEYISARCDLIVHEWNTQWSTKASSTNSEIFSGYFSKCRNFLREEFVKVNEIFGMSSTSKIIGQMVVQAHTKTFSAMVECVKLSISPTMILECYALTEHFINDVLDLIGVDGSDQVSPNIIALLSALLGCFEACVSDYIRLEEISTESQIDELLKAVMFPSISTDIRHDSYGIK